MLPGVAFKCQSVDPELITKDNAAVILRTLKSPVASVALRMATETGSVAEAVAPARVLTLHVKALEATEKASERFWTAPGRPIGSPISARDARIEVNQVFACPSVMEAPVRFVARSSAVAMIKLL